MLCFLGSAFSPSSSNRQIFSPLAADLLTNIRHTNDLGYKDVIALSPEPHDVLVKILEASVPKYLSKCREQWDAQRPLLVRFAQDLGMGDPQLSDQSREPLYHAFARELFDLQYGPQEAAEDESDEPGY
jgi:hypothetical protein